ncbi:MAG: PAS domain-containing protein [Cyanobacteria bacterium J007]|nr:MAG: PAS domain-containing protein [Cyanobacteria bacterium J007]
MGHWPKFGKLTPTKIVAIYALVGSLWILFSDRVIALILQNPEFDRLTQFQTVKGWVYVIVTALLLDRLIRRYATILNRSREQLKRSEERLEAIVETTTSGIVVLDTEGRITLSNQAAAHLLGYPRSATLGGVDERSPQSMQRSTYPTLAEIVPFDRVRETGQPFCAIEYEIHYPDRPPAILSIDTAPLYDGQGRFEGAVVAIADISERKHAEAIARARDLAEARNRAKSEFLAQMSHEIRTPLNGVLGLSQILQREIFGPLNPKQREYINRIKDSGDHLLELINDILDLSKIEAGKAQLQYSAIEVAQLCKYCLKIVQERAYERGLQLTTDIDPQVRTLVGDERRLKQILLNLLSNAVKFTPEGQVSLRVEKTPPGLRITVADTGIGIAPEDLPLVFEPFHQIQNDLNAKTQGTGLGLALSRDLARLHGGDLDAESTPGQGSRFHLYLPDLPSGYLPPEPSEEADRVDLTAELSRRTGRVAIVEPDRSTEILLRDYLQALGCEIEIVTDSDRLFEESAEIVPDLILLDVSWSNFSRRQQWLSQLRDRAAWQGIPAIAIAAMAMAGDRDRVLEAGATDYLTKPIQLEQLDRLLLQYLPGAGR